MARDIDRKLRLTAALLGTVTRKDLAAAFRNINRATSFDIDRADKWLQGRSQPRQLQVYDDWARVLDIDKPGRWIADCGLDDFLGEICARHGRDPEDLRRRIEKPGGIAPRTSVYDLSGTYVCYSHAWSPYFSGHIIRGEFVASERAGANHRLYATYTEVLPTGPLVLAGTGALSKNDLRFDLRDESGSAQLLSFVLFSPKPPASVLAGFIFGTVLMGPEAQPSMSRIIIIRLPGPSQALSSLNAYLPQGRAISEDLRALGFCVDDPAAVDIVLAAFLEGSHTKGFDQLSIAAYRPLVDQFDRNWLRATMPQ